MGSLAYSFCVVLSMGLEISLLAAIGLGTHALDARGLDVGLVTDAAEARFGARREGRGAGLGQVPSLRHAGSFLRRVEPPLRAIARYTWFCVSVKMIHLYWLFLFFDLR